MEAFQMKGMLVSKALTCMIFFCINKNGYFYYGDGYLWLYCCTNHLYISHISRYAPTNSV